MNEINTLRKYWVCVGSRGWPDYGTIAYTKSGSIKKFVGDGVRSWVQWKKEGWKCIKVDITFKAINKP